MLPDEKKSVPSASDVYAEAQRDESAITMRSIFVAVRLALNDSPCEEDIADLQWLLHMGQYLADIETYRPE